MGKEVSYSKQSQTYALVDAVPDGLSRRIERKLPSDRAHENGRRKRLCTTKNF